METLSFKQMLQVLQRAFDALPDHRRGKNVQYEISDAAAGAFAVFFTQSPSFLGHQRDMQRQKGRNNGSSLFGLREVPTDNQIRNLLDPIETSSLQQPFWELFAALEAGGVLDAYRSLNGTYLCALDGTYYFSSQKIRCDNCTVRTHDEHAR